MVNISSAAQQFNNNKKLKLKKPAVKPIAGMKKVKKKKEVASGTLGKQALGAAALGGTLKKKKSMSSY
jgi:hypothetical protein|tara:strand:- start:606 stop:809 length:204 start_codon:yes stop_codon:yes gene_type:complete